MQLSRGLEIAVLKLKYPLGERSPRDLLVAVSSGSGREEFVS